MRVALRLVGITLGFAAVLAAAMAPTLWWRGRDLLDATWQRPHFAIALVLVPVALWFSTLAQDARKPRLQLGSLRVLAQGARGLRPYLRDVPGVLRASALVLLVGALCRPVNVKRDDRVEDRGIDIVVALDLSGSMRAVLDGDPNDLPGKPELERGQRLTRLDAAKLVVRDFIGRRRSDRIGVVVFAKKAYILSPPTLDYTLLSKLVSKLSLKVIDDSGTAIGDALATSVARLRRSDAQSKVVLLLTDGDNNSGVVSPEYAADLAAEQQCRVFAIQIGNGDEVEVDLDPDFGGPRTVRQRFPVNPELLQRIADKTDGKFFVATDGKALGESMHAVLDQLEKTRFEAPRSSYEDLFALLLVPGVALVGLDALLRALLLRRFP